MEKRINIGQTDSQRFNGANHFKNFVNYLLRTDRAQKWTNERTLHNTITVKISGTFETSFLAVDLSNRKKVAAKLNKEYDSKLLNEIYYLGIDNAPTKDILQLSADIADLVEKNVHNQETICYVLHTDQGEFHIHRVFLEQ